jgi:hypothetical protein
MGTEASVIFSELIVVQPTDYRGPRGQQFAAPETQLLCRLLYGGAGERLCGEGWGAEPDRWARAAGMSAERDHFDGAPRSGPRRTKQPDTAHGSGRQVISIDLTANDPGPDSGMRQMVQGAPARNHRRANEHNRRGEEHAAQSPPGPASREAHPDYSI